MLISGNHGKYWPFLFIMCLFTRSHMAFAQVCTSPDLTESEFDFGYDNVEEIDATHSGTIKEFQMVDTTGIDSTENSAMGKKYIDAVLEGNLLRIHTTDEYPNYEMEQSNSEIILIITLRCTSFTRMLVFRQKIKESNNHDPTFLQDIYEFNLLLPLPKLFDLTIFQEISAHDYDLRNNKVTFSSPDSTVIDVGTSTKTSEDGKTFYATLITNQQLLNIEDKIQFTIVGTDNGTPPRSGSAQIIIRGNQTVSFVHAPIFDKALYKGTINTDKKLQIDNPQLKLSTWSEKVKFNLVGGDSSLFLISNAENIITVTLSKGLTDMDLENKLYFETTIQATHPETDAGSTVLLIDILRNPLPPIPEFDKTIYRGFLDSDGILTTDNIEIILDTWSTNVIFNLSDGNSSLFSISNAENVIHVKLAKELSDEELVGNTYLITSINAYQSDVGKASSVLLVDVGTTPVPPVTPIPKFEKVLYTGNLDNDIKLTIEDVIIEVDSYSTDFQVHSDGVDKDFFILTKLENILKISPSSLLTETALEDRNLFTFTIIAENSKNEKGESVILINIPQKVCLEPPEPIPNFENKNYSFWIKSNEIGSIGTVLATIDVEENIPVVYSIEVTDNHLSSRLTINQISGQLILSNTVLPGEYSFVIIATNTEDLTKKGYASAILTVDLLIMCPEANVTVNKSLIVKYLEENEEHHNIMNLQIEDCSYVISAITPSDLDYFHINTTTNSLSSIPFDRESDTFSTFDIPQIQVILKLNCNLDGSTLISDQNNNLLSKTTLSTDIRYTDPEASDGRFYVLTNDILYTEDITALTVIIKDVNDNEPIFEYPMDKTLIGYPDATVVERIMLPFLIQVRATDKDVGINAQIRYTLNDNDNFRIDPENGKIYPTDRSMNSENKIQLKIAAIDRNGAEDGLKTTIDLTVYRLEVNHLTVVTVNVGNSLTLEDFIENIKSEIGIGLMVLHYTVTSTDMGTGSSEYFWRNIGNSRTVKMIIYAFDRDVLMTTDEILKKLERISEAHSLSSTSYENFFNTSDAIEDNFVLLIVIAVLGALLIITGIGVFCLWWYKIRPYEYKTVIDDSSSQVALESNHVNVKSETSPPFSKTSRFNVQKRDSSILKEDRGQQDTESTLPDRSLSIISKNGRNSDSDKEYRKSQTVTFNELVERIDIETGHPEESTDDVRL